MTEAERRAAGLPLTRTAAQAYFDYRERSGLN